MAVIRDQPEGDHSLEEMAAIAGLTPSHFCRVFKKAYGVTPANGFPATVQQAYVTYDYSLNGKQTIVIDASGNRAELRYDILDRKSCWLFPSTTLPVRPRSSMTPPLAQYPPPRAECHRRRGAAGRPSG